jgi:hypothetical protein
VAGCCECGDEPSGSCATELVSYEVLMAVKIFDARLLRCVLGGRFQRPGGTYRLNLRGGMPLRNVCIYLHGQSVAVLLITVFN